MTESQFLYAGDFLKSQPVKRLLHNDKLNATQQPIHVFVNARCDILIEIIPHAAAHLICIQGEHQVFAPLAHKRRRSLSLVWFTPLRHKRHRDQQEKASCRSPHLIWISDRALSLNLRLKRKIWKVLSTRMHFLHRIYALW